LDGMQFPAPFAPVEAVLFAHAARSTMEPIAAVIRVPFQAIWVPFSTIQIVFTRTMDLMELGHYAHIQRSSTPCRLGLRRDFPPGLTFEPSFPLGPAPAKESQPQEVDPPRSHQERPNERDQGRGLHESEVDEESHTVGGVQARRTLAVERTRTVPANHRQAEDPKDRDHRREPRGLIGLGRLRRALASCRCVE
jgi:hypothetical protein